MNTQPEPRSNKDPYTVGQYVGMMFVIQLVEDKGVDKEFLNKLKVSCAEKSSEYLKKPPEDVLLMVDKSLKQTGII